MKRFIKKNITTLHIDVLDYKAILKSKESIPISHMHTLYS